MSEFNLSNNREVVKNILKGVYTGTQNSRIIDLIFSNVESQDKEFIRLLKEELQKYECSECLIKEVMLKEIDKLAGEKLK